MGIAKRRCAVDDYNCAAQAVDGCKARDAGRAEQRPGLALDHPHPITSPSSAPRRFAVSTPSAHAPVAIEIRKCRMSRSCRAALQVLVSVFFLLSNFEFRVRSNMFPSITSDFHPSQRSLYNKLGV